MPLNIENNMFQVIPESATSNEGLKTEFTKKTEIYLQSKKCSQEVYKNQQGYILSAGQAAKTQLNNTDKLSKFAAIIHLNELKKNADFILTFDSDSAGLSYAIALSLEFREQLDKRDFINKHIVATGKVDSNGNVEGIEGLENKIKATIQFITDNFIFLYPQKNHYEVQEIISSYDEITREKFKPVKHLCDALKLLIGESYDGVMLGENSDGEAETFKGLDSFGVDDGHRYYGREEQEKKLFKKYQESKRLIVVTGPSGVGKSSIVQASLIFNLLKEHRDKLKHKIITPSLLGKKNSNLITEFIHELFKLLEISFEKLSSSSFSNLAILFKNISKQIEEKLNKNNQYIFYIDQFEELLNANEIEASEKEALIKLMDTLAIKFSNNITIVLSVRIEFKQYFQQETLFYMDEIISEKDINDIIEKYVGSFNYEFDYGVDSLIAHELIQLKCPLPSFQFLIQELQDKAKNKKLTLESYKALNGVKGALATVTDKKFKYGVEDLFFEMFVGCNNDNTLYRRKVSLLHIEKLDELINDTLKELLKHKIVVYSDLNKDKVEIAHESLINLDESGYIWPKFKGWYQKRKDYLIWFNQVETRYNNWLEEKLLAANDN